MAREVVEAFVDAKLERTDVSIALYQTAADIGGPTLVKRSGKQSRKAMEAMIHTARDVESRPGKFSIDMMFAAMTGTTRFVLEAGASPVMVRQLKEHLVLLCQSYMTAVTARTGNPHHKS